MWVGLRKLWRSGRGLAVRPDTTTETVVPPVAEPNEAEGDPAPDVPILSTLIRAACRERGTSVWCVVLHESSASVITFPADVDDPREE
jgi:hypothetical protein